eukprot:TRINITY_DN2247_c0_g1_i6.p1 TRINITY_DN2247_c0_g1~~TRINITY_DN2247_c0_g1_i6.p1  ORF type:complete len:220 (+),score=30.90 TRINITY_DN2247_c0_g1_i6:232-891(+)
MSVLYSSTSPFSPDVVQNYKNIIESNVVTGMCDIVTNLERFEHEVRVLVVLSSIDLQVKEENRKHVRYFLELQPNTPLSSCSNKIASLWEDPSITQTWRDMSNQEVLVPHYSYFVEKLDQIVQPDYVPTNEDIMKCRQRTSGVSLTEFMVCLLLIVLLSRTHLTHRKTNTNGNCWMLVGKNLNAINGLQLSKMKTFWEFFSSFLLVISTSNPTTRMVRN